MARKSRSRLQRDLRNGTTKKMIVEAVRDFPRKSGYAHPMTVWKYIAGLCVFHGTYLKIAFVTEISGAVKKYVDKEFFPDERAMGVIMFPEGTFGRKEHHYEISALCPDVMAYLEVRDPIRVAVYEHLFYRCHERWFDAIEAASRALIEQERTRRTDETQIVDIVRKIETDALKRAFIAKANV